MSGRQSKPFQATELDQETSLHPSKNQFSQKPLSAAFDQAAALLQVDGDIALLGELTRIFIEDTRNRMNDLQAAIKRLDGLGVERIAHSIKGALSIFQARPSVEAAERVEILGRSRELDFVEAAFAELESEIIRLIEALNHFLEGFPFDAAEDQDSE